MPIFICGTHQCKLLALATKFDHRNPQHHSPQVFKDDDNWIKNDTVGLCEKVIAMSELPTL